MTTTPAEPYDFFASAEQAHLEAGHNFQVVFDHYWNHEWVFKGPGYFMMAGRDPNREDAWLVWWAEMKPAHSAVIMLRILLKCVPYHKQWIGWARPYKGRVDVKYYSTDRLISFTKQIAQPHAQT